MILYIFYLFLLARFFSVVISAKNEKKLKLNGAIEFGAFNSKILVISHFVYYGACAVEGYLRDESFNDLISTTGLCLYVFSILMLYLVIYQIRHIWTVKLIIANPKVHVINKTPLFKYVRHPNYFLNIVPELIGFALLFHAWYTLCIGFVLYLIPLITRIVQEESVMKKTFSDY